MMCIGTLATAAVLTSIAISAEAQSQSADERAIRDLIARYDKGESVARTDWRFQAARCRISGTRSTPGRPAAIISADSGLPVRAGSRLPPPRHDARSH